MRSKYLFLYCVTFYCQIFQSNAQTNQIETTGAVGINTLNPSAHLEVFGNQKITSGYLKFSNGSSGDDDGKIGSGLIQPGLNLIGINSDTYRKVHLWGQITQQQNNGVNSFIGNTVFSNNVYANGISNVGTGPTSYFRAGGYLTIGHTSQGYSPYISFNAILKTSENNVNTFEPYYADGSGLVIMGQAGQSGLSFIQKKYESNPAAVDFATIVPSMFLNQNKQIGIGMPYTDDFGTDYKLAVNGGIFAKRIKITQGNGSTWPDYVFDSTYQLSSLETLEKYVSVHKHLPEVASAEQIQADGIDVGENQAVLLKKIEELTLYIIQINKMVKEQARQLQLQSQCISARKRAILFNK